VAGETERKRESARAQERQGARKRERERESQQDRDITRARPQMTYLMVDIEDFAGARIAIL